MKQCGKVWLVGAGPGDPELLTLRAARLLAAADVVVYDRLVSESVLDLVPTGAARIDVGKSAGHHHATQEDINEMLVRLARAGHRVVRLKGGDPFVFGRGGEEALALARAGIAFEVVPGVTAAVACTAYAGIPVTHRGLARGVTFVTGHCRASEPLDLDWQRLADPGTTLVVYMGLAHIEEICARLREAGLPAGTPAAAIANGTRPDQRRVLATLSTLPTAVAEADLDTPVLFVVGEVVRLAGTLDWFAPEEWVAAGGVTSGG